MFLIEFIIDIVNNLSKSQKENGSFPSGHNGPYYDTETPVRNTSHITILLANCYKITKDQRYLDRICKAADYLCSKESRPYGYSFYLRSKSGKDKCNGLIGQAWTIEALAEASNVLTDGKYVKLASEVFLQHPFDFNSGLWNRIEIDGSNIGIDKAFNHQLWFAACSSLLYGSRKNTEIESIIKNFMDLLSENINIYKSGLILHQIKASGKKDIKIENLISKIKKEDNRFIVKHIFEKLFKRNIKKSNDYKKMIYKSIGYHSFNMYAFAILKESTGSHYFWDSQLLNKPLKYILSPGYQVDINGNLYSYPYNPPGFEVPYVLNVFSGFDIKKNIEISSYMVNSQLRRCYNKDTKMLDRNTTDSTTLTARLYELLRIPVQVLEKINVKLDF
jgi:hypothetical protein